MTLTDDVVQHRFGGDGGVARLLEQVLNPVLQGPAQAALQAAPDERTPERRGYRHGLYDRALTPRVGTRTLRGPRRREGSFSPEWFARYQRPEQACVLALLARVIHGVSTRKVPQRTEELWGTELSKAAVSALGQQLDPIVPAWRTRSLTETGDPFLRGMPSCCGFARTGPCREPGAWGWVSMRRASGSSSGSGSGTASRKRRGARGART